MFDRNAFLTRLFGYNKKKVAYPSPWDKCDDSIMSADRTIHKGEARSTSSYRLAYSTIYMLRSLKSGKHVVAEGDKSVYLEYHSNDDHVYVLEMNYDGPSVTFRGGSLSEGSWVPFGLHNSKTGPDNSTAFFMLLVAGIKKMTDDGDMPAEFTADGKSISELLDMCMAIEKVEDELEYDNAELLGKLSNALYYFIYKDEVLAFFGDIPETEKMERMDESDFSGIVCSPYPLVNASYRDAEYLRPSGAKGATKKKSTGTGVVTSDLERLEKLREELKLDIHPLTAKEKDMIPRMGKNYICDDKLVEVARTIKDDWHCEDMDLAPNIILEGDAGSGKTAGSKFLADVLNIPRTKITMNPMFESANLIGAFYPVFNDTDEWGLSEQDAEAINAVRSLLESSAVDTTDGGHCPKSADIITAIRRAFSSDEVMEKLREVYGIPSADEISFDPQDAWERLGKTGDAPVAEEVLIIADKLFQSKAFRLLNIIVEQAENGGVNYRFIMSELMKAFQNGWLVEVQEAASVLRPGVLTELNSLLEPGGRIELPNGSYIYRHPDTIVVFTTNRDYQGNVDLNESLRDRCTIGAKMDLPPVEVMASRAMAQSGLEDKDTALAAATAVRAVCDVARINNIRGSFGMRSLIAWMRDLKRGKFEEERFKMRVVYKMTTRDDDVAILMDAYRANCKFASAVKTGKAKRV